MEAVAPSGVWAYACTLRMPYHRSPDARSHVCCALPQDKEAKPFTPRPPRAHPRREVGTLEAARCFIDLEDGEQSSVVRLRSSVKVEAGSGGTPKKQRRVAEEAEEAEDAEPAAALMQLAGLASTRLAAEADAEAAVAAEGVPAAEADAETDGGDCCAICTDPLVEELWTCGECEQAVHRACLMEQVLALRSQRCVCVLPGLCSCRPAPTCPLCRAGLPPSISGRHARKCGTRGCTPRDGHGGLCSSAPPVSTDAHNRARRRMQHAPATEATEEAVAVACGDRHTRHTLYLLMKDACPRSSLRAHV